MCHELKPKNYQTKKYIPVVVETYITDIACWGVNYSDRFWLQLLKDYLGYYLQLSHMTAVNWAFSESARIFLFSLWHCHITDLYLYVCGAQESSLASKIAIREGAWAQLCHTYLFKTNHRANLFSVCETNSPFRKSNGRELLGSLTPGINFHLKIVCFLPEAKKPIHFFWNLSLYLSYTGLTSRN